MQFSYFHAAVGATVKSFFSERDHVTGSQVDATFELRSFDQIFLDFDDELIQLMVFVDLD